MAQFIDSLLRSGLEEAVSLNGERGTYTFTEANWMFGIVSRLKPTLIIEWGTHIGKSARIFWEALKWNGLPGIIHTIDLPAGSEYAHESTGKLVRGKEGVKFYEGDGLDTALRICGPESNPLVFIDGDHRYEGVRRDLAGVVAGLPLANILLHDTFDYTIEHPTWNSGPFLAIKDVVVPGKYKRDDLKTPPGMTLLEPIL